MRITFRHDLTDTQRAALVELVTALTHDKGLVTCHRVDGRNVVPDARVRTTPNLTAGRHRKDTCGGCGAEVWVGPSQRRSLKDGTGVGPICMLCCEYMRRLRPDAFTLRFIDK